jgi:hypothetical protein
MSPRELSYYRESANEERWRANSSACPEIAEIHVEVACLYEKLIQLEEPARPTLNVVTETGTGRRTAPAHG